MANKEVGYKVAKYLIDNGDSIVALFLSDVDKDTDKKIALVASPCEPIIFSGTRLHDNNENIKLIPEFDFIITVYWPFLLKKDILKLPNEGTINFHPALLPHNRGWYPHVFSIIKGSPAGVTLHSIDKGIDTGKIWAQKEVEILSDDTSDSLYFRLQKEILKLFKDVWPNICTGNIRQTAQDSSMAVYNSINDIDKYNEILLDEMYSGRDIINLLRSRVFGNTSFSYFIDDNGDKINVKLSLSKQVNK